MRIACCLASALHSVEPSPLLHRRATPCPNEAASSAARTRLLAPRRLAAQPPHHIHNGSNVHMINHTATIKDITAMTTTNSTPTASRTDGKRPNMDKVITTQRTQTTARIRTRWRRSNLMRRAGGNPTPTIGATMRTAEVRPAATGETVPISKLPSRIRKSTRHSMHGSTTQHMKRTLWATMKMASAPTSATFIPLQPLPAVPHAGTTDAHAHRVGPPNRKSWALHVGLQPCFSSRPSVPSRAPGI